MIYAAIVTTTIAYIDIYRNNRVLDEKYEEKEKREDALNRAKDPIAYELNKREDSDETTPTQQEYEGSMSDLDSGGDGETDDSQTTDSEDGGSNPTYENNNYGNLGYKPQPTPCNPACISEYEGYLDTGFEEHYDNANKYNLPTPNLFIETLYQEDYVN